MITWGSKSVIYNLFTCDANFLVWHCYLQCQSDVIYIENFDEILKYLFQILTTPLSMLINHILSLMFRKKQLN